MNEFLLHLPPRPISFISAPQICNIMNVAADEMFKFQVRDLIYRYPYQLVFFHIHVTPALTLLTISQRQNPNPRAKGTKLSIHGQWEETITHTKIGGSITYHSGGSSVPIPSIFSY